MFRPTPKTVIEEQSSVTIHTSIAIPMNYQRIGQGITLSYAHDKSYMLERSAISEQHKYTKSKSLNI